MTYRVKDLSKNQKAAIESLLGRAVSENEEISITASADPATPGWLRDSWESARRLNVDQLSVEEIDEEIRKARGDRKDRKTGG